MSNEKECKSMNWDELRVWFENNSIKNTTIIAEMPRFSPPRVLRGVTEGIEPFRNATSNHR